MLRGWTKANGRIMEERLIAAVADYPELYNSTLSSYKDADKKAKAWRAVSLQVELPEEDCRRKWKSLRDMFIKDKRSEQRRRASGGIHRSWKYSWQMAFLTPFIQSRTSQASAAMDELDEDRDDDDKDEEKMEGGGNPSFVIHEIEGEHSEADPPAGWQGSRRKRRWQVDGLEGAEDEMFLLSLVPYLKRLPYEKKSAIKLKFHQLLYEAEFQ
ncbi:MADF and BESS domain-containing protein [Anguilla rostrata]|uniref:MADF domain-containing protein n=1 Tax=Anguilla anguilla TaxID=7936 RepID=A0A9D3ME76_ANGAN|nr:uncharacterized protein LOC118229811 [Anguilla anguilla]KAG5846337.1 hypothetical protein ANANG_G00113870 [Anguilla anguilla]